MTDNQKKRVLIIGTNMMAIYNHRLELIKALLKHYIVTVAAPTGGEEQELIKLGCHFIDNPVDNRGTNLKTDLQLMKKLADIYKETKADIILTFYTKTNIYGGLVARFLNKPYIENICGLGSSLGKDNLLSKIMGQLYKGALKKADLVFFQNESNRKFFVNKKLYNGKYEMLPGSGVSLERYQLLPYPPAEKTEFLFASRLLKEKGFEDYVDAAYEIKKKYPETVFHVVGPCDPECEEKLDKAIEDGIVVNHGKLFHLHDILKKIHCTVHPSYYPEGMSNILLESAASGRPIITTPLPGCIETVNDNITGFIVKEKDAHALARMLEKFILLDYDQKKKMGEAGREKMEREFDRNIVTDKYLLAIEEIIN